VGDSASEILPFLNVKAVANKVAVAMKEKDQGNSAYALGEYPKAVTHYTRAIKLNPRFDPLITAVNLSFIRIGVSSI
jgi:tetratricopeptide (TPR) repeat protein